jgi:hypothetical protein
MTLIDLVRHYAGGHADAAEADTDTCMPRGSPEPPVQSTLALPVRPQDEQDDWHARWEERAAIMEFDGGLARSDAERAAVECTPRLYEQMHEQRMGRAHDATM